MEFKDYYKIMGVAPDASAEQIKKAYRRLARKYHPDVSRQADAEARFKEIQEAYAVLKDTGKRAEYDELRRYGVRGGGFRPPPGWRPSARQGDIDLDDIGGFSDFFQSFFGTRARDFGGGGARRGFRERGRDITSRLTISLEEAHHGGVRELQVAVPRADGPGRAGDEIRTVRVSIPAGVAAGQQIRLKGQGAAGSRGGPAGDLYLEIDIAAHPLFQLDGRDIALVLPIAPWEAGLGATVDVPTLGGRVKLKIPPGSQSGQRLRLRGRGLPGRPPGDQYVVLQIRMPPLASDEARAALQRLRDAAPFDPRTELAS